jgi:solute carrier family 8 (sodium/calcium exchanger)
MALGSSAPEIILSIIEIVGNDFYSGALGPSTIVGSAAFNLFCIVAVCIVAIPPGPDPEKPDGRVIEDRNVFSVTATFSVFAYVWLIVILVLPPTPDVCTFYEGLMTFLFFPALVSVAFGADKGWFASSSGTVQPTIAESESGGAILHKRHGPNSNVLLSILPEATVAEARRPSHKTQERRRPMDRAEAAQLLSGLNVSGLTPQVAAKVIAQTRAKRTGPPSRAQLRRQTMRSLTGGKRVVPERPKVGVLERLAIGSKVAKVYFGDETGSLCTKYGVAESEGKVKLTVHREPAVGFMRIKYATVGMGEAEEGKDYVSTAGELCFADRESSKEVVVEIIDDDEVESDERFKVVLSGCSDPNIDLASCSLEAVVTIIDDDLPGEIGFAEDDRAIVVKEGDGKAYVTVSRFHGSKGSLVCKYRTDAAAELEGAAAAVAGRDYVDTSGTLTFGPSELRKVLTIPIVDSKIMEKKNVRFDVVVSDVVGPVHGAKVDTGKMRVKVSVVDNHEELNRILSAAVELVANEDEIFGSQVDGSWSQQFRDAWEMEVEDGEEVGRFTIFMHVLTVPWKLLFAICPPTKYGDGWVCFFCALLLIGLVTGFIGDLAGLFGCALGLSDATTAITFVALGTSLPDTFASKAAAECDTTADAAIGNVTGSNGVNVFLGLGLPWLIAAAVWDFGDHSDNVKIEWANVYSSSSSAHLRQYAKERQVAFAVPAGALGLSVGIFCFCACACFGVLLYRRKTYGMELGGPEGPAKLHAAFLVGLWFIYVVGSITIENIFES